MANFNIDTIKSQISSANKTLLFKNKYNVTITKVNQLNPMMTLLASSFEIPAQDFTTADCDIGGHIIGVASKWMPAEIQITFYNTGQEYKDFNKYASTIYNQENHAFGYHDDIVTDITCTEFYPNGSSAYTIEFKKCYLRGIGNIVLSYEESTSIETFTATFGITKFIIK